MATRAENLNVALDNIAQQLADLTESPKPTYSIDGKSVSWGEHFNNLISQQTALYAALQAAEGCWELRSIGRGG